MDISSGLNRPISLYGTNTGNNINLAIEGENKIYEPDNFVSKVAPIKQKIANKRKKKNRRLNTFDIDFLPDEAVEAPLNENNLNFFVEDKFDKYKKNFKKAIKFIFTSIPLINWFYLKHKGSEIKNTVETLNNIMQNADELLSSSVPYGENSKVYGNIAQNLTDAANIIGKSTRFFEKDFT